MFIRKMKFGVLASLIFLPVAFGSGCGADPVELRGGLDEESELITTAATRSIFDPSWQTGTKITAAQVAARFAPGATRAVVGKFGIAMRSRSCNAISGCSAWTYPQTSFAWMTYRLWIPGPGWSPQKSCFQFQTANFPSVTGTAAFVITGTKVALSLEGAPIGNTSCDDLLGPAACANFKTSLVSPSGGSPCWLPNDIGSGFDPDVFPVSVPLYSTTATSGSPLNFNLLVTAKYAYALSTTSSAPDSSGSRREVQYALYVALDGKAIPGTKAPICTPTTCAAKAATCGFIDDGCGGKVNCGDCSYPYLCKANQCELPPGCNLQPCGPPAGVGYTCCGPGQTTCGGASGCTCYDACH